MGSRPALKERELGSAESAQGLFVNRFLTRFDKRLVELSIAIDDGLLGPAETSLINLAGLGVFESISTPLLGLALHVLLVLDDLPDLFHEEIVDKNGVGSGDDVFEPLNDFLNRLSCFREMRMSDLWLAGLELLSSVRQFVACRDDLLGAEGSEGIRCFAEGSGVSLLSESVGLQVLEEKAKASHDRIDPAANAILAVDLDADPLLGANDTVCPLVVLLGEA